MDGWREFFGQHRPSEKHITEKKTRQNETADSSVPYRRCDAIYHPPPVPHPRGPTTMFKASISTHNKPSVTRVTELTNTGGVANMTSKRRASRNCVAAWCGVSPQVFALSQRKRNIVRKWTDRGWVSGIHLCSSPLSYGIESTCWETSEERWWGEWGGGVEWWGRGGCGTSTFLRMRAKPPSLGGLCFCLSCFTLRV